MAHGAATNSIEIEAPRQFDRVARRFNDQAGIQALSTIPSREELLGKLLGSMQSPIANFARVLNQIAEQNGGADAAAAE